jgi:hypothetical protein
MVNRPAKPLQEAETAVRRIRRTADFADRKWLDQN